MASPFSKRFKRSPSSVEVICRFVLGRDGGVGASAVADESGGKGNLRLSSFFAPDGSVGCGGCFEEDDNDDDDDEKLGRNPPRNEDTLVV